MSDPDPSPLAPRDLLILLTLADGPLHGYGMLKEAESLSGGEVRMDPANLYRALRRLLRDGLVEEQHGSDDEQRRVREYRLSALGTTVVRKELGRLQRLTETPAARRLLCQGRSRSR